MEARIDLDASPRSVGRARRFCATTLAAWGAEEELISDCVLLVSELATNAVLHAGTPLTVTMIRGEHLRVTIDDGDARLPERRDHGLRAMSGRGLHLVEAVARASGSTAEGAGKSVWFELDWAGPVAR